MGHSEVQTEVCSLQTKPLKTEVLKSGIKKIYQPELMISDCAKMYENQVDVVASKWARGNSLLVGLINKLRSKARVATIGDKMEADDEKPGKPEAVDPEENGSDTAEGSDEVCDVYGTLEVGQLVKTSGDIFEKVSTQAEEDSKGVVKKVDPDLCNDEGCEEFGTAKLDQLVKASGDTFEEVSKQAEGNSKGEKKVVVASEYSSNPDEDDAKLSEEEFLQVFGFVLLIYGFATELLVMEGLARSDISPQGKEMDEVKDVEMLSERIDSVEELNSEKTESIGDQQNRLKAKGYYNRWDTRRLMLMLNMEPRLVSVEMDAVPFYQSYELLSSDKFSMMYSTLVKKFIHNIIASHKVYFSPTVQV